MIQHVRDRLLKKTMVCILCALAACIVSCGGDDDDDDDGSGDYFPNADGSVWKYDVTDHGEGTTYESTSLISGTKQFAGRNCQVMIETATNSPGDELHQYVIDTGSTIESTGYEIFENGSLTESFAYPSTFTQFVYPLSVGQTWVVFDVTGISPSQWDPEETDDDIDGDGLPDTLDIHMTALVTGQANLSVPAGTYDSFKIEDTVTGSIHGSLIGTINVTGIVTKLWFSPNVGIVKSEDYEIDGTLLETAVMKSFTPGS